MTWRHRLWLAEDSEMLANWEWVSTAHPPSTRLHSVIFTVEGGGDILQPKYLKQMTEVRKRIYGTTLTDGSSWKDFCLRTPVVKIPGVQVTSDGNEDPSLYLYPEPYCSILNGAFAFTESIFLQFSCTMPNRIQNDLPGGLNPGALGRCRNCHQVRQQERHNPQD